MATSGLPNAMVINLLEHESVAGWIREKLELGDASKPEHYYTHKVADINAGLQLAIALNRIMKVGIGEGQCFATEQNEGTAKIAIPAKYVEHYEALQALQSLGKEHLRKILGS